MAMAQTLWCQISLYISNGKSTSYRADYVDHPHCRSDENCFFFHVVPHITVGFLFSSVASRRPSSVVRRASR